MELLKSCPKCGGSGLVNDDQQLGEALRVERIKGKISLRKMATLLDKSPAYISDLELGRRRWHPQILKCYESILKI